MILVITLRRRELLTRRDRLAMIAALLDAIKAHQNYSFNRVCCASDLNHSEALKIAEGLLACGYIEQISYGARVKYHITEKGRDFVAKFVELQLLVDEIEGERFPSVVKGVALKMPSCRSSGVQIASSPPQSNRRID